MEEIKGLTEIDYKNAVDVQNACNISGVTKSLFDIIQKVREEGRKNPETNNSYWVENHPIVQAYVYKLMDMSLGLNPQDTGYIAINTCREMSTRNGMFRELSLEEEVDFRQWARENYIPFTEINTVYHPVVQDECRIINQEEIERSGHNHIVLTKEGEELLRQDTRDTYKPGTEIGDNWHPVTRDECEHINIRDGLKNGKSGDPILDFDENHSDIPTEFTPVKRV